jgi:hypothetical protein
LCRSDALIHGLKMFVKLNNRQAFEAAWAAACKVEASTVLVPSGLEFVVGPISFSGPYCKPNILFQVKKIISTSSNSIVMRVVTWAEHKACWLDPR